MRYRSRAHRNKYLINSSIVDKVLLDKIISHHDIHNSNHRWQFNVYRSHDVCYSHLFLDRQTCRILKSNEFSLFYILFHKSFLCTCCRIISSEISEYGSD